MEYCTVAADGENIVINILGETTSAYRTNIGGIVGLVNEGAAVDNCTNNGYISSKMQRNDDAARWEYIGGVVGVNNGTVSNSENTANIATRSAVKYMSVGGVVGFGELESGIIDGCKNSGTLSAGTSGVSPYGGRYVRLAGICAQNNQHVSNVSNSGNFDVSRVENSPTLTTLEVGGCIGSTTADIAGDHNIVNTGIITTTLNVSGTVYTAFGGVVGNAEASVSGVENRGTVSIEPRATVINLNAGGVVGRVSSSTSVSVADVVNYGNVQFDYTSKKGEVPGHTDIHMGGIIGASENTPLTVSNAVNYGRVDKNNDVKATGKSLYVGGIAGYLANAKSQ